MVNRGGSRAKILFVFATISISLATIWPSLLQAQRMRMRLGAPVPGDAVDDENGSGSFPAPDRNVLQSLNRAQKVLKEHRYGEALEGLALILSSSDDFLYQPDGKGPVYKSLKAKAQELLGEMPGEGRALYEARSGAEARDKLNRAVAAGDAAGLSEVSAQWFHTEAGYEATYLLALYHMDHGAPLAAALTLKRLREAGAGAEAFEPGLSLIQAACYYQSGMLGECRQVLVDLKRRLGTPALQVAGHEVPWFEGESDAPAWLAKSTGLQRLAAAVETDRWAMFRGDPARNASTVGSAPLLNLRWRVPVAEEHDLQTALVQQEITYRDRNVPLFSGLHPLAVGDKILMRTARNVLAVDFHTGKAIWETKLEQDPTTDVRANRMNGMIFGGRNLMSQPAQYGQRIWDDATYGTLSSDGKLVFVIEELPLAVVGPNTGFMMGGVRTDPSSRGVGNRLVAYDIHGDGQPQSGGKLQWEFGDEDPKAQADTFFLGPPLPLRGQLYVMAEIKDEIQLLALDGTSGRVLWTKQLAMVESNVTQDPVRRLAGVSPSYSDGVLICPTGAGCVVAVDLASHSLLWGYVYDHPRDQAGPHMRGGNQFQNAFNNFSGSVPRWLDGTATIVNGRVLLTPAEADSLYCLNLADGKPAWECQPRGDHYYVACVHKGVVVLVGRNAIDAINLDDGRKAWGGHSINMPSGAGVCGHGCYAGSQYFVPLSSGEVMSVDLETGKVISTAKSRRSAVPGNLVCYRGRVISQGLDGLELYYQADAAHDEVARRLAANPDDVEGLTLRGEMYLDAGKAAEAVADFRRAYIVDKKSESQGRTRELLRDALLAGLRDDFAAHRSMAGEVEPLLDDADQRATYFRCMATGLHRAGQWREAVEFYLKLVDQAETKPALEQVDRSYLVRRDCWVQARLGAIRSEGGAAAAAEIDRALEHRLEEAEVDTSCDGLKRFLAYFGNQPQGARAREELLKRLAQAGRVMEAELLMAAEVDPMDRKAQAALLAEMALLNFRASRLSDAAACFRQLEREFADVPCHAGMTPVQWLAVFPDGSELRREVALQEPAWPAGEVEVDHPDVNENRFNRGPRMDMLFGGPSGPFFTDCTVSLEGNQQEVSIRDGMGILQRPVRLVENGRMFQVMYNPNSTLARSCGHLLLISMGTRICALDPWKAAGSASVSGNSSQILWTQDLTDSSNDNVGNMVIVNNGVGPDFRANPFGPVNARYVSFLRKRNLVAVDPLTGETLWVRQDTPPGSQIFGDEHYLFVLPPGSDEALVYRAADGHSLGVRKMPRPNENNYYDGGERWGSFPLSNTGMDFFGRYALTWQPAGGMLALFDPWLQKTIWTSRAFASGARASVVGNEAVGVLEPSGHFVLCALADGRTLADLQLPPRPHFSLTDLVVTRMGDQYIVLAQDNTANGNDDGMQAQGMFSYPVRRGRIYAIDLKGKLAWTAPTDVDHQQFLLSQPGRLPVLIFANFHYENQGGQMQLRTSMRVLDRRNGRIVYDQDLRGLMRGIGVEIRGDPSEKTVRIATNSQVVHLTFTDKPVKSSVRQSSDVQKPSGKFGEALLDALQGAARPRQ